MTELLCSLLYSTLFFLTTKGSDLLTSFARKQLKTETKRTQNIVIYSSPFENDRVVDILMSSERIIKNSITVEINVKQRTLPLVVL